VCDGADVAALAAVFVIALCIAAGRAWAGVLFGLVADAISGWAIRTSAGAGAASGWAIRTSAGAAIECRLSHVCGLASYASASPCAADSRVAAARSCVVTGVVRASVFLSVLLG
jgi:hypothetical protein